MRTIAVVNQKGGCGKTITAINLAAFLARENKRVLLVDMDPQGHATLGVSSTATGASRTLYDVFATELGERPTRLRGVTRPARENLDLAPSDIMLATIPERLAGVAGREDILAENLAEVKGRYDFAIVDCPPNVGLLTFNALRACTEAIVPMDPSFFSLHGIGKLLETFDLLEQQTGHRITPRVLLTLYSGRTPFVKAVVEEIRKHLSGRHFQTVVRYSVKLAEAASHGVPIALYSKSCAGYEDYRALTAEVLQQEVASSTTTDRITIADVVTADEADEMAHSLAPAVTAAGVMFTIEAPGAERVQLAGDFNGWDLAGGDMSPAGRIWKTVVPLEPGRYRYRYVVDGRWQSDPLNPAAEPSPYGGNDSILVVKNEKLAH
ncbi:MAG TPA: AAA family ATPase [Methylomirabilota bacterium]|jgi:chromosome partitioning protein